MLKPILSFLFFTGQERNPIFQCTFISGFFLSSFSPRHYTYLSFSGLSSAELGQAILFMLWPRKCMSSDGFGRFHINDKRKQDGALRYAKETSHLPD